MKNKTQNNQKASITVFLSLILLLILALIMTVIEGARRTTAMVFAERALITSMDSVLAGFYGPLMDEYHVLGLNAVPDEGADEYMDITNKVQDYMLYTLNPSIGIDESVNGLNLYSSPLTSIELLNSTKLVDHQGKVFIHEATEYMKYRTAGDAVEFFLDKASLLEQPKKVSVLYEEKVELEEKLVTIDEGLLALMKYIDGLSTGKKGLNKTRSGKLKTEEYFTKKILFEPPTMESVGVNNKAVFLVLEDQYVDPSELFSLINNGFINLEGVLVSIEELENKLTINRQEAEKENKSKNELENTLENNKKADKSYKEAIKKNIAEHKKSIFALDDEADILQSEISAYKITRMSYVNTITAYSMDIYNLISGSLAATEQAISELEQIINAANDAEPLIKSYEKNLKNEKEELETEVYDSLEEGLNEIKRYQIDSGIGYDFLYMKDVLNRDKNTLTLCIDYLDKGSEAINTESYSRAKVDFSNAYQELQAYEIEGLNIDYSSLVIKKEKSPDYLDGMKDLIKGGITGLVIDSETISDKEISEELLPSIIDTLSKDEKGFSFSTLLKNMKIGAKDSKTGDLFASFGNYSLGSLLGNAADEILERILIQGYIDEHFNGFPVTEEEKEERRPSVLTYEKEYLLCGKPSDSENIESVIGKLILIRTLLNFTSILGDKEKWREAKTIASSLVGFTGLPILIAITQGILMILLALASALVDTCALLIGKELPIIKKEIDLKYYDLLLLTRENIRNKAENYEEGNGFSYKDYMTLFLCLTNKRKLSYRMMDLIQENINMRYGTDISLQNCVFGYELEVKYNMQTIFTSLSFMNKYLYNNSNSPIIVRAECSY